MADLGRQPSTNDEEGPADVGLNPLINAFLRSVSSVRSLGDSGLDFRSPSRCVSIHSGSRSPTMGCTGGRDVNPYGSRSQATKVASIIVVLYSRRTLLNVLGR